MARFLTCIYLFAFLSSHARAVTEKDFEKTYSDSIAPFLKRGVKKTLKTRQGQLILNTVQFRQAEEKAVLLLINGFSENWMKYGEVLYDWYQRGYGIVSYDHRGQGLSTHLVSANSQIGHVEKFQQYVDDLDDFIRMELIPSNSESKKIFVIAHSMGGAVVARYLQTHSSPFSAVALSTPMIKLDTSPLPESLALIAVSFMNAIGWDHNYTFGKKNRICSQAFEENRVTHSRSRYGMDQLLCQNEPATVIGGPSNGWVAAAIVGTRTIREHPGKIETPILMLQAGMDEFVENEALSQFCLNQKACHSFQFSGAKHEILMEEDPIRNLAFDKIDKFFNAHSEHRSSEHHSDDRSATGTHF
jgi:lysophospholipase